MSLGESGVTSLVEAQAVCEIALVRASPEDPSDQRVVRESRRELEVEQSAETRVSRAAAREEAP